MPTYVYRRSDGTTFEIEQRITEPALEVDPETGLPVTRIISGSAGLIFKGSGFYLTDYARKNGSPSGSGSNSFDKTENGKTETKSTRSDTATTEKK